MEFSCHIAATFFSTVGKWQASTAPVLVLSQPSQVRKKAGTIQKKTNVPDIGPIVRGRYFIVERPTGGRLGPFKERLLKDIYGTDRSTWFGLFRDDGKIDDYTFVQGVKRGNFRLHPIGPLGLSEGCITLQHPIQFNYMRDMFLKSGPTLNIPGSQLKAYGTVKVY